MKREYVKPEMLVENFVATQSVALNCGYVPDYNPIGVKVGDYACENPKKPNGEGGYDHDMGHIVQQTAYDKYNVGADDKILTVFNDGKGCELSLDGDAEGDLANLGKILTGTGGWNSDSHRMVLGETKIPSV